MASVEHKLQYGPEVMHLDHAASNSLADDKEGLKSGQAWTQIPMEDSHNPEAVEQGYTQHSNLSGSRTSQSLETPGVESDAGHPEVVDIPLAGTPTISIQDTDPSGERMAQSSPSMVDREVGSQSGPRPPERRSSRQFSSGNTSPLPTTRSRSDTQSTGVTSLPQKPSLSSMVFVITALENIAASKDAKKRKQLGDSVQRALAAIRQPEPPNPEVLFEPLQLASQTTNITLITSSLDCIGKLISYSYFSIHPSEGMQPSDRETPPPLIERAIETICDCFQGEATSNEVQLQIVGSLLAAVLNDKIVVHGAGLLKAVRQIYNIFLLSKSSANQQVAQGTLAQMVGTVFERVNTRMSMKEARLNLAKASLGKGAEDTSETSLEGRVSTEERRDSNGESGVATPPQSTTNLESEMPAKNQSEEKITLQSFENRTSFDDTRIHEDKAPTMVTRVKPMRKSSRPESRGAASSNGTYGEAAESEISDEDEYDEIYIKDAFLVFRAMCKLSTKLLSAEQVQDLKSPGMRSKLLSLHLIHTILKNNMAVITSPLATIRSSSGNEPTSFVQAIKQYLCLSLSRNGASHANKVFEVSCEIFWLMLKNMRVMLKKEIEVFLKEIYLAILDKRTAPIAQKIYLMSVFERLSTDPRALVEIYLNYDCDRTALDNMFQRIIEHLSKLSNIVISTTTIHQQHYQDHLQRNTSAGSEWHGRGTLPPSLSTASITTAHDPESLYPPDYALKRQSLFCLVETLRSLVTWSQQGIEDAAARLQEPESRNSVEESRDSFDATNAANVSSPKLSSFDTPSGPATPQLEDDPGQLEKAKIRKTSLINGIRQFNFKPKRGIKYLVAEGFIPSDSPEEIATFLLYNERVDKAMIGEYLGEGEPENIAIMHAFVDLMDFTRRRFVDALRQFLQSFRLPGEAQKIDRFMLKFAERYISGNPNAFANADTAYVLAYSVIMLNTDQHSGKIKARMTKEDFIKNNRGINDNADLPDEYLSSIYDEIAHNEIVLNTERENAAALGIAPQPNGGLAKNIGQALATVGRDLQREAYALASEEMANKTEQLFRSLVRAQRKNPSKPSLSKFIPATSFRHVGPMFDVTWMSFLSGLTGEIQNTQNIEVIKLCMEGLKLAIRISCLFDLQTPRQAFVSALAKSTNLSKLDEMMAKNLEAMKALLEVAQTEGNLLKSSWGDVMTCISQLDRFQLISGGVDEGVIPDMAKARIQQSHNADPSTKRKSLQASRRPRPKPTASNISYRNDVATESRSSEVMQSVDRIFTGTAALSGDAIVHFVRALCEVSWQEIQSSGQSESPRTYSLQKLVEISDVNMKRVRFEWTHIWQVLGEHFNRVGCHNNTNVVFFALDSLRQLSRRFMEIEELPGFKFQKDFLKPFEHVMANSGVHTVKDMVLRCLIQMIQACGHNIRSGWKTMFGVFTIAAREQYESIVNLAFDNVNQIYNARFGVVISQGAFADMVVCLTEFSKNSRFPKKSLQAIETLKLLVPKMLKTPECSLSNLTSESSICISNPSTKQPSRQSQEEQFWFPVLSAFYNVLMTGDDLEIRSRALGYLFDTLIKYGGDFLPDFWDILWLRLLEPIFMVLKPKPELSKHLNHEELSVWLSSTMVQALRNMITLFTHYFSSLEYMLDRFLDLLELCIRQENDTIARIGSNCLQQLVLENVSKFEPEHWTKIVGAFVGLFDKTTASELFHASTSSSSTLSNGGTTPRIPVPEDGSITDSKLNNTVTEEESLETDSKNAFRVNGLLTSKDTAVGPEVLAEHDFEKASPALRGVSPPNRQISDTPSELEDYRPQSGVQQQPVVVTAARRREFTKIIARCVLQLLMIDTVNELFSNDAVYNQIPSPELLRLMGMLKKSYLFAKKFNGDKDLRMRLWREGFMKQPPNLLKQESGSAATYISILLRMYHDEGEERKRNRVDTEAALIPLCADIIRGFTKLDEETQQRNITAWRPVIVDIIEGYINFPRDGFEKHINTFYPLAVGLLNRDLSSDVRVALQSLLRRIGEARMDMPPTPQTPTSPKSATSSFPFRAKRTSRGP